MDAQAVKNWLASKQGGDTGEVIQPKVLVLASVVMELEARLNALDTGIEKEDDETPKGKSKKG